MSDEAQLQEQSPTPPGNVARADPTFKLVTSELAWQSGLRLTWAELPQSLTADFVLEVPPELKLDDTLFSFLAGYDYAVLDFKGQGDPLDEDKLLTNVARTALFCIKKPANVRRTLNLLVCSRYPQEILRPVEGVAGFSRPDEQAMPWLWLGRYSVQEIAIVVCRDLPLEPRFYNWLAFAPADSEKWKALVRLALKEGRRDLIELMRRMRPKEVLELATVSYLKDLDPEEEARINEGWGELFELILPKIAVEDPVLFKKLLGHIEAKQLAEAMGAEQLIEVMGAEQLTEAIGMEQLAATLTDEQLEEIMRRRRAKKEATEQP